MIKRNQERCCFFSLLVLFYNPDNMRIVDALSIENSNISSINKKKVYNRQLQVVVK